VEILTTPKNSLTKQYQKLFEMEDVKLSFTKDALLSIANYSIIKKTGARGLRSILENILLDTMFKLPVLEGLEEVVINAEVVKGKREPYLVYSDKKNKVDTSA
jgi:ATP-dependent Clp protease ATP-binding subunit ClpX